MPDRNIRLPEVCLIAGIKKRTVYDLVRLGRFPVQKRISHKVAVWSENAVRAWVDQQHAVPEAA